MKILTTAAPADTLTKVQVELAAIAEKISTSSTEDIINELLDKLVSFGLKLLAAFLIYLIGAWIIRKIKGIIAKIFEKKKTDAAISSFIQRAT